VQQKKEKTNPPAQTTKQQSPVVPLSRFKPQTKKEQNVWEVWSDETRVVVYSKYTTTEGVATERVHLLLPIFVTAPVFQLDTSELNADAWRNTARERVQQRKRMTIPPQTTKKSTVS
jgi:hypothetical protein